MEIQRRELLIGAVASGAIAAVPQSARGQAAPGEAIITMSVSLRVNGQTRVLQLDTRTTLLDALREHSSSPAPRRAAITASAAPAR